MHPVFSRLSDVASDAWLAVHEASILLEAAIVLVHDDQHDLLPLLLEEARARTKNAARECAALEESFVQLSLSNVEV